MTDYPLHSVSVAGAIFDNAGRVLLIKRRDNGDWQPPGGLLELGETFEEGVRREVLEETGLHVRVRGLTGVYKNIHRNIVALVYRCDVHTGTAVCTAEASAVEWLELDSAFQRMAPVFAIRIRDAANSQGYPASRSHDGLVLVRSEDS